MNSILILVIGGLIFTAFQQKSDKKRNMILIGTAILIFFMFGKEGLKVIEDASTVTCIEIASSVGPAAHEVTADSCTSTLTGTPNTVVTTDTTLCTLTATPDFGLSDGSCAAVGATATCAYVTGTYSTAEAALCAAGDATTCSTLRMPGVNTPVCEYTGPPSIPVVRDVTNVATDFALLKDGCGLNKIIGNTACTAQPMAEVRSPVADRTYATQCTPDGMDGTHAICSGTPSLFGGVDVDETLNNKCGENFLGYESTCQCSDAAPGTWPSCVAPAS